jgi:hypothetical protein
MVAAVERLKKAHALVSDDGDINIRESLHIQATLREALAVQRRLQNAVDSAGGSPGDPMVSAEPPTPRSGGGGTG